MASKSSKMKLHWANLGKISKLTGIDKHRLNMEARFLKECGLFQDLVNGCQQAKLDYLWAIEIKNKSGLTSQAAENLVYRARERVVFYMGRVDIGRVIPEGCKPIDITKKVPTFKGKPLDDTILGKSFICDYGSCWKIVSYNDTVGSVEARRKYTNRVVTFNYKGCSLGDRTFTKWLEEPATDNLLGKPLTKDLIGKVLQMSNGVKLTINQIGEGHSSGCVVRCHTRKRKNVWVRSDGYCPNRNLMATWDDQPKLWAGKKVDDSLVGRKFKDNDGYTWLIEVVYPEAKSFPIEAQCLSAPGQGFQSWDWAAEQECYRKFGSWVGVKPEPKIRSVTVSIDISKYADETDAQREFRHEEEGDDLRLIMWAHGKIGNRKRFHRAIINAVKALES